MEKIGKGVSLLILPLIAEIIYSSLKSFLLNDTPIWNFEVTLFLYGAFFMLGAAYCHKEKKHVAVDVLLKYVSPGKRKALLITSELVVLLVVLAILYAAVPAAYKSIMIKERSMHQTPFNPQVWWFKCIIPITCAMISWQSIRDLFDIVAGKGAYKDREAAQNGD